MFVTIIIVFFSLIALIALHELGHFVLAKKFGVKVEEFGIFLPPRLWGKQFGETLYSINLLPLGAFVRLYGEEERSEDSRSFSSKPVWQRSLIVLGGVISFWIIAIILLDISFIFGAVQAVEDSEEVTNPRVQIVGISSHSPAEVAGLKVGDIIISVAPRSDSSGIVVLEKVIQLQEFAQNHKGEEIVILAARGTRELEITVVPRQNPPEGEGALGVMLARTAEKKYSPSEAFLKGFSTCALLTKNVVLGWGEILGRLIRKEGMPPGAQILGPIGIGSAMNQAAQMGISYYLQFLAIISVYLAVFNILPIPALDGGKFVFLIVEAVRRKPVSVKFEQIVTAFFFLTLILMTVYFTIKDIVRLF